MAQRSRKNKPPLSEQPGKSNAYVTAMVVILQSEELKRDTVQKKMLKGGY